MKRRFFTVAVVGLLLVPTMVGLASWRTPSGAAGLSAAGWWWRAQTGQGPALPSPPQVPADGLDVANGPNGANAISAVRFQLFSGEAPSVLTLKVREAFAPGDAPVVACATTANWFSVQAGAWEQRPEAQCGAAPVAGQLSEDGASMAFNLSGFAIAPFLDVVLLPDPTSTTPFDISFEAPQASSLTTAPALDSTSNSDPFVSPDPSFGSFDDPITFGDPIFPSFTASTPIESAEESEPAPSAPVPGRFQPVAAPSTAPAEGDPRPLALVILAAVGIGLSLLRREPLPSPRLLGPMAARMDPAPDLPAAAGGLGRFRRDRAGSPRSLA